MNPYLDISPEVAEALAAGKPVVALESTIISHGMPYPKNVETALLVEQTLRDNGDKLSDDDKSKINAGVDALKEALKGEDMNLIKSRQDELTKTFYEISERLYQQANPNGGQGFDPNAGGNPNGGANVHDDGTVESEFTD